jgi:hypothetical protein
MFSRQGWCWEKILWSGYKRRPVRTAASPNFVTSLCHQVCTPERGVFKLHFSAEPRRILNAAMEVRDADNIKQHPHTHQHF